MGGLCGCKQGVHDVLEFEKCARPPVDEEQRDRALGPRARFLMNEVYAQGGDGGGVVVPF